MSILALGRKEKKGERKLPIKKSEESKRRKFLIKEWEKAKKKEREREIQDGNVISITYSNLERRQI